MELLKIVVYFIILLIKYLTVDAEPVLFKEIIPTTATKRSAENNYTNKAIKVNLENEQRSQKKPLNLNVDYKTPNSGRVSSTRPQTQLPLITNLNTKLPLKLPLIMNPGKAIPLTTENFQVKTNSSLNMDTELKTDTHSLEKAAAEDKTSPIDKTFLKNNSQENVRPEDILTPKSKTNISHTYKDEEIHSPKYKPKPSQFYLNNDTLTLSPTVLQENSSESASPLNQINQLHINEPSSSSTNELPNKTNANEIRQIGDDFINVDNGTHCIYIKKIANLSLVNKTEMINFHKENIDTTSRRYVMDENLFTVNENALDVPLTPTADEKLVVIIKNNCPANDDGTNKSRSIFKTELVNAAESRDGLSEIISITNRNYEEVEEIPDMMHPKVTKLDLPTSVWTTCIPNIESNNPFNNYYQSYQSVVPQYFNNYLNKGNWYSLASIPSTYTNNIPKISTSYPSPYKTQISQEYLPKPDFPDIIAMPVNPTSKIWRTWKDTEIKINKPNVNYNNPTLEYFKNCCQQYYSNTDKTLQPYSSAVNGFNGYYINVNKPITYP